MTSVTKICQFLPKSDLFAKVRKTDLNWQKYPNLSEKI